MNNDAAAVARPPPAKTLPASRSAGRGLALCALAVALLAVGGSAIWIARVYAPFEARIEDALASSDRGYTGLGGEVRSLDAQLTAAQAAQAVRDSQLAALARDVAGITAQLAAPVTSTANVFRLARIEHLVKFADISLRLARDRAGAEAALVAAQAELDMRVPIEAALHETLSTEQAAISAVIEPDVGALSAEWAETALQADSLPWRAGTVIAPQATGAPTSPSGGWRGMASAIWQDLLHLVEIRPSTATDEALLDPAREALIKARLQTEIATLRGALERRVSRAVHTSAAVITQLLESYFDVNDSEVSALLAELAQLASIELAPALPTVDASLREIKGLQQAHAAWAPAPEPPEVMSSPEISAPVSKRPQLAPRDFM